MTADPFAPEPRETALWTFAALFVAVLHIGLAVTYLLLRPAPEGRAEAPVIDVAFMPAESKPAPAAPEALPAEPVPPVERSAIEPPKEEPIVSQQALAEPVPPVKAEPVPQPEPPPPVALTAQEPAAEPPSTDQLTVAPPPPPKPAETTPESKKPVAGPEKAERKPAHEEKEKAEKRKEAQAKPAAAPGSKPTRIALAPNPGAESAGSREAAATWKSEVLSRIRSAASYATNGNRDSGTAQVNFTVARNGRVVSRRLAGSSGSPALDSAAMSVIERAQPFPPFPAGMTQAQIALTVPLHLHPR
ncbi:energy transducer TonB [Bradyrhizobium sp.]|uniref:energy transducer TonB family protein n=1 Tax=Bradyrhizobium sp. TaxID=376 RepID=UPI00345C8A0D